jgi:hypothetical protein
METKGHTPYFYTFPCRSLCPDEKDYSPVHVRLIVFEKLTGNGFVLFKIGQVQKVTIEIKHTPLISLHFLDALNALVKSSTRPSMCG